MFLYGICVSAKVLIDYSLNRRPVEEFRRKAAKSKLLRDAVPSSDNRSVSHLSTVYTVLPCTTSLIARPASVLRSYNDADVN